jgi:hypothetical protein
MGDALCSIYHVSSCSTYINSSVVLHINSCVFILNPPFTNVGMSCAFYIEYRVGIASTKNDSWIHQAYPYTLFKPYSYKQKLRWLRTCHRNKRKSWIKNVQLFSSMSYNNKWYVTQTQARVCPCMCTHYEQLRTIPFRNVGMDTMFAAISN